MAGMAIDGLVSNLDTTSLINQLMQVESAPQTLLKTKQTNTKSLVTALQALNTKVASLAESAAKVAKTESWQAWKATSSSSGVTAAASSAAQAGSLSFRVDSVATSQVTLSAAVDDGTELLTAEPPALTVRKADGTLVAVTPASGSVEDVASAINAVADTGISATAVRVGETSYRLQFTAASTGTDGRFEVFAGTEAEVTAGTATRIDTATVEAGTNAQVTLWKGSAYEKVVNQSSNTFEDLMSGVDVTVSAATAADADPVVVTVARDTASLTALAKGFVGSIGVVLSEISSRSSITTTTNSDGTTSTAGGLFTGDSAVRTLQQRVVEAASYPVGETSPSAVGINLAKDGTFTFDETAFTAALAADPAKVQEVISTLAQRVADVATSASDKYEGTLTLKIQGQESLVKDMGLKIEDWDRRLALRKEGLQATYSALEVTLGKLQSQQSWLTSQLETLSTSS
jgi:flagellar hook-associated protein 2